MREARLALGPHATCVGRRKRALTLAALVAATLTLTCSGVSKSWAEPQSHVVSPQNEPPEAETSATPIPHKSKSRQIIKQLSDELTEYLHRHRLPHVDAIVFGSASGDPRQVELSGAVRTDHGKSDAQQKALDYLSNPTGLRVDNHIEVDPDLARIASAPSSSGSAEPPPSAGAPAQAQTDPCLCLADEDHCRKTCLNQAANPASADPSAGLGNMLRGFLQGVPQNKQCADDCENQKAHCVHDCTESGGTGATSQGHAADNPSEGPDQPPS